MYFRHIHWTLCLFVLKILLHDEGNQNLFQLQEDIGLSGPPVIHPSKVSGLSVSPMQPPFPFICESLCSGAWPMGKAENL